MNGRELGGAVPLGGVQVQVQEVTIYPVAVVDVVEGGDGIGDATHHLKIVLVPQAQELRIPYNMRALRELGRKAQQAGGVPQAAQEETEGN